MKSKSLYFLLCLVLIAITVSFFPLEFIQSFELKDNPEGCPYYITLQSILANNTGLASDGANTQFIKQRLVQFENDINKPTKDAAVAAHYKNNYYSTLASLGLTSIQNVNDDHIIIATAKKSCSTVDHFYLDGRLFCVSSLYEWKADAARRIIRFNLSGLYSQLPNKFSRILFAVDSGYHLGAFSGFNVNTQTTTLNTQFMTGLPLLTALYVLPNYSFDKLGSYSGLVPWCAFWAGYVIDPFSRKILNISGIDVFTLLKSELITKKIKFIPDAIPLATDVYPEFGNAFQSYINTQSYGLAYLANHIYRIKPTDLQADENTIKAYFAKPDHHNPANFHAATAAFYKKLEILKVKRDILIEDTDTSPTSVIATNTPAGSVEIQGMVGPRALFTTHCSRAECEFVFNTAKAFGWNAIVNGNISTIRRANFAFMATKVPQGNAIVWFIYEPITSLVSYFISIFTLISVFAMSCPIGRLGRQQRSRISK